MARTKQLKRRSGVRTRSQTGDVDAVADVKVGKSTISKANGKQATPAKGTPAGKKGKKRPFFRQNSGLNKKAAVESVTDFAGLIFMCNTETKKDCFKHHVFGLPEAKKEIVERAKKGIKLFLFDIDQKVLYGVYRASSLGGMNLVSEAFQGSERKFPAQIRFRIYKDCAPLEENEFKPAIKENYFGRNKFRCELTSEQVGKLVRLFRPLDSDGVPLRSKSAKDAKGDTAQKNRTGSGRGGKFGQAPAKRYPRPPVREPVSNYPAIPSYPSNYSGYAPDIEVPRLGPDVLYASSIDGLDRRPYVDPVFDPSLRLASDLTRRRLTDDVYSAERLLPKASLLYDDLYRDLPYSSRGAFGALPYKSLSSLPWAYP